MLKTNERLVSVETKVQCQWGSEALKFGIKQVSNFHHEDASKLTFRALALHQSSKHQLLYLFMLEI